MRVLILVIFTILPFCNVLSQNLEDREKEDIYIKSKVLLNDLNDRLNLLSSSYLTIAERAELVSTAISGKNRLFIDGNATILDDLNPVILKEIPVDSINNYLVAEDYLETFSLFYSKYDTNTVKFSPPIFSEIKEDEFIYLKVRYISHFLGYRTDMDTVNYPSVEKIAEIVAEKNRNKWNVYFSNIQFVTKNNTFKPFDLSELNKKADSLNLVFKNSLLKGDSIFNLGKNRLAELKENKQVRDEILAFFVKAKDIYSEARNIPDKQDDKLVLSKLSLSQQKVDSLLAIKVPTKEELFKKNILVANSQINRRLYRDAITTIDEALSYLPGNQEAINLRLNINQRLSRNSVLESYVTSGQYNEAKKKYSKEIKNSIKAEENDSASNSDLFYGRGIVHLKLEDSKKALDDFSEAVRLDPKFVSARIEKASILSKENQIPEAIGELNAAVLIEPEIKTYIKLSNLKLKVKDIDGAIATAKEATEKFPTADTYTHLGNLQMFYKKDFTSAIKSFDSAILSNSDEPNPYLYKGISLYNINNYEEAGNMFENAISYNLEKKLENKIDSLHNLQFNIGEVNFLNRPEDAIISYKNALLINKRNYYTWYRMGSAYLSIEKYEDAIDAQSNSIKNSKDFSSAYFERGNAKFALKRFEEALEDYKVSIEKNKKPNEIQFQSLGLALQKLNFHGEAIIAFKKALEINEEFYQANYQIGESYYEINDYNNAINFYSESLDVKEAYFKRGLAYQLIGEYRKAEKDLTEAENLGVNNKLLLLNKGLSLKNQEDYSNAISSFKKATELDEKYDSAYYYIGECYEKLSNWSTALAYYNEATNINVKYIDNDYLFKRGMLLLRVGDNETAKADFDKILSINENSSKALFGIGCYYVQKSERDNWIETFKKTFTSYEISKEMVLEEPILEKIKNDKDFKDLKKNLN